MTIQAETTDNEVDWRYPVMAAIPGRQFCYACWYTHGTDRVAPDCALTAHPRDLSWSLAHAEVGALRELRVPDATKDWHPAHTAIVRTLVAELQDRIDLAEVYASRAAENR